LEASAGSETWQKVLIKFVHHLRVDFVSVGPVIVNLSGWSNFGNGSSGNSDIVILVSLLIHLVELGDVIFNQFVLEGESESDLETIWSGLERGSLGIGVISEVKVDLGLGELDEGVGGPQHVPTTFIDLGRVDVFGKRVVLKAVLNWLHSACAEGNDSHSQNHSEDCAAQTDC
jgi:hypothetical protein